jgi:hypothetical protein
MLTNSPQDIEKSNPTPVAVQAPQPEPGVALGVTEAKPPASEMPAAGAEPSLALVKASSPAPGLQGQIQKLKSAVPDVGVLGVTQALSDAEYVQLLTCEEIVAMANHSWLEAGRALTQIRDRELWRGIYLSFEDYCAKRWGFGRSKVYYLIGAASVCDTLRGVPDLLQPEVESQLRALVCLDPPKRIEAWQRAAGRAGSRRITSGMVRAAAKAVQAPAAQVNSEQKERRREQLERRRQLRELMSELLEFIMKRRPYEELIQKAAAVDGQIRFFFPAPRKR